MNCSTCGGTGVVPTVHTIGGESFTTDDPCFECRPVQLVPTREQAELIAALDYADSWRERKTWHEQYEEAEHMARENGL